MEIRPLVSKILELAEKDKDVVLNRSYWLNNTVLAEKAGNKYYLYSRDGLVLIVENSGDDVTVMLKKMGEW